MKKLIIMGKSAAGKDYFGRILCQLGIPKILTYTTRPPRAEEKDGEDYHFLTEEEFLSKAKEGFFMEYRESNTTKGKWYYGSTIEGYREGGYIIITPEGFRNIRKGLEEAGIEYVTILLTAEEDIRLQRSFKRGDDPEEVMHRLKTDDIDFAGIKADITLDTSKWTRMEAEMTAKVIISEFMEENR